MSARLPALDGLRALAILLVIPHNVDLLHASAGALPWHLLGGLFDAGWIGVQLFFALSGFLITGGLLDTSAAPGYYASFYWRRILRILPLYYATLTAALLLLPVGTTDQVWLWTFLSNWTEPFGRGIPGFGHFWSLAVEEQFYLLWPLFVRRHSAASTLRWSLAVAAAALAVRAAMLWSGANADSVYMFTICRMDALALGAAAAAALRVPGAVAALSRATAPLAWGSVLLLGLGALLTHGYAIHDARTLTFGQSMLALVFAVWVALGALPAPTLATPAVATSAPAPQALATARRVMGALPLRLVSRYSYAMYVFHPLLHHYVGLPLLRRLQLPDGPWMACGYMLALLVATFALAALSYYAFERHFLRLKRHFAPWGAAAVIS